MSVIPKVRSKRRPEAYRWQELATFNAERARGIKHTKEWRERMAKEQVNFDAWSKFSTTRSS